MFRHWNAALARQRRRALRLTQAEVAQHLNVQRTTVAAWEGGSEPQLRYAGALADLLGLPLDSLFAHDPEAAMPATGRGKPHGDGTADVETSAVPALNER